MRSPENTAAVLGAKVITKVEDSPAGRDSGVTGGCDSRNPVPVRVTEETVSACELLFRRAKVHATVWPSPMLPKVMMFVELGPVHGEATVRVAAGTEAITKYTGPTALN